MKKIIILIPVYNDWESLEKLIGEISKIVDDLKEMSFDCFIINDASTITQPQLTKPKNIKSIKIFDMKKNRGHQRCNAFGIRYIFKNKEFDNLILMDGDGEDRPIEIKSLIIKALENSNSSVVAKRVKRSEGPMFRFFYIIHKIITYIFTGQKVNFGNFSCLTKKDVGNIYSKASLWNSISGTVKKNLANLNEIDSIRGTRYFGPSKMPFFKLLLHSFSIIAVFKHQVFLRSAIMIIGLVYLNPYIGNFSIFFQIILVLFNLLIFLVSLREKKEDLIKSQNNLDIIKDITH